MSDMLNQADHDLLIVIAEGQKELKSDVRAMSDALRELKTAQESMNERQRDIDARVVNLTSTVTRLQGNQYDDHKDIGVLKADHTRWKLYMKVALVLLTPIYLVMLALLIEYGKQVLFP